MGWVIASVIVVALATYLYARFFRPRTLKLRAQRRLDRAALATMVREARTDHDAYEKHRVEVRGRPGWHEDQRTTAIAQRVVRELHKRGLEGDLEELKKLVRENP